MNIVVIKELDRTYRILIGYNLFLKNYLFGKYPLKISLSDPVLGIILKEDEYPEDIKVFISNVTSTWDKD